MRPRMGARGNSRSPMRRRFPVAEFLARRCVDAFRSQNFSSPRSVAASAPREFLLPRSVDASAFQNFSSVRAWTFPCPPNAAQLRVLESALKRCAFAPPSSPPSPASPRSSRAPSSSRRPGLAAWRVPRAGDGCRSARARDAGASIASWSRRESRRCSRSSSLRPDVRRSYGRLPAR